MIGRYLYTDKVKYYPNKYVKFSEGGDNPSSDYYSHIGYTALESPDDEPQNLPLIPYDGNKVYYCAERTIPFRQTNIPLRINSRAPYNYIEETLYDGFGEEYGSGILHKISELPVDENGCRVISKWYTVPYVNLYIIKHVFRLAYVDENENVLMRSYPCETKGFGPLDLDTTGPVVEVNIREDCVICRLANFGLPPIAAYLMYEGSVVAGGLLREKEAAHYQMMDNWDGHLTLLDCFCIECPNVVTEDDFNCIQFVYQDSDYGKTLAIRYWLWGLV